MNEVLYISQVNDITLHLGHYTVNFISKIGTNLSAEDLWAHDGRCDVGLQRNYAATESKIDIKETSVLRALQLDANVA